MIYKLRDWLREDENAPYVEEGESSAYIERLTELEDWLYEDGADANYTIYEDKAKNMTKDFDKVHRWVNAEFMMEKCLVGMLNDGQQETISEEEEHGSDHVA